MASCVKLFLILFMIRCTNIGEERSEMMCAFIKLLTQRVTWTVKNNGHGWAKSIFSQKHSSRSTYYDDAICYWTDLGQSQRTGSPAVGTKPSVSSVRDAPQDVPHRNKTNKSCVGKRNIRADVDSVSEYVPAVYTAISIKTGTRWQLTEPLNSPLWCWQLHWGSVRGTSCWFTIPKVRNSKLDQCTDLPNIIWNATYTSRVYLRGKNRHTDCFVWYLTMLLQLRSLFSIEWEEVMIMFM